MTCPLYIVIARKSRPKISPCCSKTMPLPTRSTNLSIKRVPSFSVTITRFPRLALVCVVIIMRQKCHISCVRHHAAAQVLNVLRPAFSRAMLFGAGRAALALITHAHVRVWHHHPTAAGRSWLREPPAAIAARLVLRLPPASVSRFACRHVVHPVLVAVSVVWVYSNRSHLFSLPNISINSDALKRAGYVKRYTPTSGGLILCLRRRASSINWAAGVS